jgi:hypothetical protein
LAAAGFSYWLDDIESEGEVKDPALTKRWLGRGTRQLAAQLTTPCGLGESAIIAERAGAEQPNWSCKELCSER